MKHALFLIAEELRFLRELRVAAEEELKELPPGQQRAHLWRIDGQIEELEQAAAVLQREEDELAGLGAEDAPRSLPLFPELH